MLVNSNTVKYNVIREKANITVCPKDKEAALQQLNAEKDVYKRQALGALSCRMVLITNH